jgi:hypothetical protein
MIYTKENTFNCMLFQIVNNETDKLFTAQVLVSLGDFL